MIKKVRKCVFRLFFANPDCVIKSKFCRSDLSKFLFQWETATNHNFATEANEFEETICLHESLGNTGLAWEGLVGSCKFAPVDDNLKIYWELSLVDD